MTPRKCKYCDFKYVHEFNFEMLDGSNETTKKQSFCSHDESVYIDPFLGVQQHRTCERMRQEGQPCGPDAILWEKKNDV